MDNVIGMLDVIGTTASQNDILDENKVIDIRPVNRSNPLHISANSVLGLIHRKLKDVLLEPIYYVAAVPVVGEQRHEERLIIGSIQGLEQKVREVFGTDNVGILCFVNGEEPSKGELPIDVVHIKPKDHISLVYVALDDSKRSTHGQLTLFG